jgi:hypothetical protein
VTPAQVAVNARAVANLAARLEAWGLSDPQERAEHVATALLADGLRPVEKPVPARGPGASRQAIEDAKAAAAAAVADARARRTTVNAEGAPS